MAFAPQMLGLALFWQGAAATDGRGWLPFVVLLSALSLGVAGLLTAYVLRQDTGTSQMQDISNAIKEGAEAFLRRQYTTIAGLTVIVALIIFFGYWLGKADLTIAWRTTVAFLVGALFSGISGFSGMFVSIRANIRTASAARSSLNRALQIALRGGAVTGLSVVAMSLLGVAGLFYFFGGLEEPQRIPLQLVGFGFGASFVALFAQLGGGIFTKGADVGADLVGKVEAGIPEDDPRNPAVIADLVGDNVGDCAGRGADLFESTAAENVGAMILGVALYPPIWPECHSVPAGRPRLGPAGFHRRNPGGAHARTGRPDAGPQPRLLRNHHPGHCRLLHRGAPTAGE